MALAGTVVGLAGAVGALVFAANVATVLDTPARYGWTFDLAIGNPYQPAPAGAFRSLVTDHDVAAYAPASVVNLPISGVDVGVLGMEHGRGTVALPVLEGRMPAASGELALGQRVAHDIGARVGDIVAISVQEGQLRARVVGIVVVPEIVDTSPGLGHGAVMPLRDLTRLLPDAQASFALVRLKPESHDKAMARFVALGATRPMAAGGGYDLLNMRRVRVVPWLLAACLAAVGLAALGALLARAAWNRRYDLAVLRVLGFDRGQVRNTVRWQALTLALAGSLVAFLVGFVAGRLAFRRFATGIGIASTTFTPTLLWVLPAAALSVAYVVSFVTATAALRRSPGVALRTG
jgi:ABC-type lipoprotein release transport system permease subunit